MTAGLGGMALAGAELDGNDVAAILGDDDVSVPVPLKRAQAARLLWLNHRAIGADPQFAAAGCSVDTYARELLRRCAFTAAPPAEAEVIGRADRYGGSGIGSNGGSGRAALVNGYYVKGVGQTPLIGRGMETSHISGGAYLEESIRETIQGEVIAAEFPHSAVPTLAIIDTGLLQHWTHDEPPVERRVLIVRPSFLRPAHFERAYNWIGDGAGPGMVDAARVARVFQLAGSRIGAEALTAAFAGFWSRWAQQLAYSFVHRLSQGPLVRSNIALDGRLLDFGAVSALPSWAALHVTDFSHPFGGELPALTDGIRSMQWYMREYLGPAATAAMDQALHEAVQTYRTTLAVEALRLCGFGRSAAQNAVSGSRRENLVPRLQRVFAHFQRERGDIMSGTPPLRLDWDFGDIWSDSPPSHLQPLRDHIGSLADSSALPALRARSRFMARQRSALYRTELRNRLLVRLDRSTEPDWDPTEAGRLISASVAEGRRDPGSIAEDAIPIGFAVSDRFSGVIWQDIAGGPAHLTTEWVAPGFHLPAAGISVPLLGWDRRGVILADDHRTEITCSVAADSDEMSM